MTRRSQWHPTPVLLPRKSHKRRSLVGCSPWGRQESDTTEWLHFHFSLSCIGEGNGNPLQCSCLENLRDGGAWWAAVSGVAQSRTRLKQLSSSSSSSPRRQSLARPRYPNSKSGSLSTNTTKISYKWEKLTYFIMINPFKGNMHVYSFNFCFKNVWVK